MSTASVELSSGKRSLWGLLLFLQTSTTCWLVFSKNASAKTETTKTLMIKETKRAMQDSMKSTYWLLALPPYWLSFTCLDLTRAECRYMLCGMMTAPTMPTACSICGVRQPEHDGRNIPLSTWLWLGFTVTYSYPNVRAITVMRKPKMLLASASHTCPKEKYKGICNGDENSTPERNPSNR